MTEISDEFKVKLLFKEFTGVVNAKQQSSFPQEEYAFKDYILNNNILSDNIPTNLPSGWRSSDLDASSNILDNTVTNLASIGYPQLSFHKKRILQPATFGSLKTWFITDGSGGSALKNALSFKTDPISNSYIYSVYRTFPSFFFPINMYATPTFWLFDFKSGFLEFYCDENTLNSNNATTGGIDLSINPPVISFFQYVGATGGGGGGGGGGDFEVQGNNLMQSVTIQPWSEPLPQPANTTFDINYVIATVDISGNSEMPLGYFTLQLGDPYKQLISFYAGVIENKGAFIKIISCTNENTFNKYGFKNLKIISYDGTCYLLSTFGRASGGAGDPDLLKIILVNNNANRDDNPTNNPDWILRNNPDEDWLPGGPPETKMPWTVGFPLYPVPTLPPALVTVSLLQNGGMPYGVSTQPEYFQNNIVLDTSANILAGENGTGTIDICGNLYVDRDASFNMDVHVRSSVDIGDKLSALLVFAKDISASNHIYSNGYRGHSTGINTPLILDASYNDTCSFNLKHQRGDISIGKKSEQTGWTIQSIDGIHMLTDSARMNPISVTEKTLDMSDNDIINIRTLGVQDIYSHGSLLLDYSSVEITTAGQNPGNWYDIAFVGSETKLISDISNTYLGSSASAVIEIYVIEKLESGHTKVSNGFSYVKCNVELFREQSASIEVITGFNMAASKKIIQSLRINYGRNRGPNSVSYPQHPEPPGLFQIKLSEENMSGNNGSDPTLSLYCRITDNNFISYQTSSGFEYLETTWRMHLGVIANNNPKYLYKGWVTADLPANYHTYINTREVECVFNPNVGTITSTGLAPEMDPTSRMYYINDKDSEFTSKCKFDEEVDFSNNILVRGNTTINGTLSASQYVGGIYCDGSDISNVNRINCNYCDISYGLVVGDGHSGAALDISNTSLTRLKFRGYKMPSSTIDTLVATVNTTIGTATSYNNKLYFTVNPENSPDVAFVVKTPSSDTAFVIGNTNNIECNVGLSLYRDTVANVDAGLVTNSMGIMNDVGGDVDATNTMDALVWKPNIKGSTDTKVLVNEMVSPIYNRQLTGSAAYGGIDPATSTTDGDYEKYVASGGATRYSYFGFEPTSNDGDSSSRPISSKSHFLRDTWITGLYMNTPYCDTIATGGNLFKWGIDSYVDIEIGYGNTYTQVYRMGNDPNQDYDSYYFPSSTGILTTTGGIRIDLKAKEWIYVPAGTNQTKVIRFKYVIGSATGAAIWVIDTHNGTDFHTSEIDGYVTYVQHPIAI